MDALKVRMSHYLVYVIIAEPLSRIFNQELFDEGLGDGVDCGTFWIIDFGKGKDVLESGLTFTALEWCHSTEKLVKYDT